MRISRWTSRKLPCRTSTSPTSNRIEFVPQSMPATRITAPRTFHLIPSEKNATYFLSLPVTAAAMTPDED